MALGTITFAGAAYSAQNGTSVSPNYPTNAEGDQLILVIGQKPSTANDGTVTTPTDWDLVTSSLAQGGYGATLGADTGNTNLYVYTRTVPSGGLSGSLAVTVGTNNVCWGIIGAIRPDNLNGCDVVGWGSSDATAGSVSAAFATTTSVTAGDALIWAMCIPTDVTTPGQFSAHAVSASGVTFGTVTEIAEPDSGTGNDIGGFLSSVIVSSGTTSGNTTVTATAGGTTTNVRGPLAMVRLREIAAPTSYTLTADGATYSLSGQAATLLAAKRLVADVATYSYSGLDATLSKSGGAFTMPADAGSYSYSGQDATLKLGRVVAANLGTYSLTGAAANLVKGYRLVADGTTYSYSGLAASTVLGKRLVADSVSFALSGQTAGLVRGYRISADSSSYALSGAAASLVYGRKLTADASTYSLSGQSATFDYIYPSSNSDSTLGTTNSTTYVAITDVLNIRTGSGGSLTFTGLLSFEPTTMTDSSYGCSVIWRYRTVGGGWNDVNTETTASVFAEVSGGAVTTIGEVDAYQLLTGLGANTNYEVQLYAKRGLASPANTLQFSGTAQVAQTGAGITLSADSTTYAITGASASLLYGRTLQAGTASYTLAGQDATLTYNAVGSYTLVANSATYALVGGSATLTYGSGAAVKVYIGTSLLDNGGISFTKIYVGTTQVF